MTMTDERTYVCLFKQTACPPWCTGGHSGFPLHSGSLVTEHRAGTWTGRHGHTVWFVDAVRTDVTYPSDDQRMGISFGDPRIWIALDMVRPKARLQSADDLARLLGLAPLLPDDVVQALRAAGAAFGWVKP